ncbi:MAG: hypothetical protein V4561_02215 [Bacteroidota bacterium]
MSEIHIAQIGELFQEDESFEFLSNQNMLEYDFIIIDLKHLSSSLHQTKLAKIDKRVSELNEFILKKNIPVVFFCDGSSSFYPFNSSKLSFFELLGLEVTEELAQGKKFEINSSSLFSDFLKIYSKDLEYTIGFSHFNGINISNAKAKNLSVAFYTKDFVFLPTFNEEWDFYDQTFLTQLYEVCKGIRKDEGTTHLPEWTNQYLLPGEKNERENLNRINNEISKLLENKQESERRLATFIPLKHLWSGTGNTLENSAKMVFKELGFTLLPSEPNRDDIIMKWQDKIIIVEIKGQTKSAAEKNAAQLEKWVTTYYLEKEILPKGLLLVNTYRELPLEKRTQSSFPDQMHKFSIDRNHCLLSTLQLNTLLLYCREHPEQKEVEINKLIETTGVYENFQKWDDFIKIADNEKQKKSPIKKEKVSNS